MSPNSYLDDLPRLFGRCTISVWHVSLLANVQLFKECIAIIGLLQNMVGIMVLNFVIVIAASSIWKDGEGYTHYDPGSNAVLPEDYINSVSQNAEVLFY